MRDVGSVQGASPSIQEQQSHSAVGSATFT